MLFCSVCNSELKPDKEYNHPDDWWCSEPACIERNTKYVLAHTMGIIDGVFAAHGFVDPMKEGE